MVGNLAVNVEAELLSGREVQQACVLTPFNRHKGLFLMAIADIREEQIDDLALFRQDAKFSCGNSSQVCDSFCCREAHPPR